MSSEQIIHIVTRAAVVLVFMGGIWMVVEGVRSEEFQEPEKPQIVTLLNEPIPEREEPKVEEEPMEYLEEPMETLEMHEDVPELDDVAQIDDMLGVDADASAGFDDFGLVAKRGGRDLIKTSSMAASLVRVGGRIEQHLSAALEDRNELRRRNYTVRIALWVDAAGFVDRVEFDGSTGRPDLDLAIEHALKNIPPLDLGLVTVPQPIRIRITARGAVS